nr:NAD(P)/FAD-dependent oxidoreductase [Herbihabitans rhizosphaerae]
MHDAVVIGAGQAGLAAAKALRDKGFDPVVLEGSDAPTGSWPRYYDSLTLFSPARFSSLPGMAFPGDPDRYPRRDEVVDYLKQYATALDVDIRTGHRVTAVSTVDSRFTVELAGRRPLHARYLIAATGAFGQPHVPSFDGEFTGAILHASAYTTPRSLAGQRVVVVGAGNSAVQIAVELARHAKVTLTSRSPVKFVPQRPLGRDLHWWQHITRIDSWPIGRWLPESFTQPVFDTGSYRAAIEDDRPERTPVFSHLDGDGVIWADGRRERVDTLLIATGYRPDLGYLSETHALDDGGMPVHRNGVSTTVPGLGYVGLENQRTLSSNSLRGVGRDARYVIDRLLRA